MDYIVNKEKMTAMEKIVFRAPTGYKVRFMLTKIVVYATIAMSAYLYIRSRQVGFMTDDDLILTVMSLSFSLITYCVGLIAGRKYNRKFTEFRDNEKLSVNKSYVRYMFYSIQEDCFVKYEFDMNDITNVEKHPDANMFRFFGNIEGCITDPSGHPVGTTQKNVSDISISDYFDGLELTELIKQYVHIG